MSTATLTKKELFVQGSLTTDVAEMIEILAVNVPGVKSCNVNAVNKSLVLSIDTTKDEGAVINELSSLIKTMDSSLKLTTSRQENKNNSKAQRKSAEGDKNVSIILGGLNCAHCAEVIGQKVEDLDEVEMAHLNFVNKKLSVELNSHKDEEELIKEIIAKIDSIEPGLDIQVVNKKSAKKNNKKEVIKNIETNINNNELNKKVEVGDPNLTEEEKTKYFIYYVENEEIIWSCNLLEKEKNNIKYLYAPRGPVLKNSNFDLINLFLKNIKEWMSIKKYTTLIINPYINGIDLKKISSEYNYKITQNNDYSNLLDSCKLAIMDRYSSGI